MAKTPSFWHRIDVFSWIGTEKVSRSRKNRKRRGVQRRVPFESLEERDLLTVVVNLTTTNIFPDVPAIIIQGSGFDPIVSNNTVAFNDGATGTVTSASETELTVEFATPPTEAGVLTAIVSTPTENSGSAVQVATVVPVLTVSTASFAADATTLTIRGSGFDTTASNNIVSFNNGAIGTVSLATGSLLTVTLSAGPTAAGSLNATVTTNGIASASGVQVATVVPVITSSNASLAANATSMTISGFGFSATANDNTVDFDGKAVGTVTSATSTSLTVTFSTPPRVAGDLIALVTTNGVSGVGAVLVASVRPVITSVTTNLSANATTLTVNGFGFDRIAGNNSIVLNSGAVGTVTSATANTLSVSFSTRPTATSNFTAIVTTNSVSSGAAVQVATVIPVVTSRTSDLSANASTVTINGFGFDTVLGNNTLLFNNGAVGTVSAASATSLTVTFSTKPTSAGSLTAVVTTNGASNSSPVQIARVVPVVTSSSASLAANATTVTINGFGFDTAIGNNSVLFNNGAVGAVSAATPTSLTVTFSTKPISAGSLTAIVTSNGVSSGSTVQIATVTPVVTSSTTNLAANSTTISISGFGFSSLVGNNSVLFNLGASGTVTAATPTLLTVSFPTRPTTSGNLTAVVTSNSANSGAPTQVATVIPFITSKTSNLSADATSIVINGFGFDSTASNNTVVFNNGASGTVSSSTSTSLTVTFTTKPSSAGSLTAIVTTNSLANGSAIQVATVIPVITSTTSNLLAANATTLTIDGFGFDPNPVNNLVTLDNDAIGSVTAATETQLTVTLSKGPTSAGPLNAVVSSNGVFNGTAIQVATVIPVVTSSTASLAANASTLVISGFGFDTTAGDNVVVLNNSAVGLVTAATPTELTVTFTTNPVIAGVLNATVTTDSLGSGSAVQVANVIPVITSNAASIIAANASSVIIAGYGFDSTIGNNTITLDDGAVGTISAATPNELTVTFSTKPTTAGLLSASVTTNSLSSGSAVPIASVAPVLLSNSAAIQVANASTIVLIGIGFDTSANNNTVVFDSGAIGTVTSATSSSLNVSLSSRPTSGTLRATVTTNSVNNGSNVSIATVRPVVTSSLANIAADSSTITIDGFGFDATSSNNTVSFNNGAIGTVTASTSTTLTVTFSTRPTTAGSLTAIVTSNGIASGTAIRVGTVTPVVSNSTASLARDASSVVIDGFGFDPIPSSNSVLFNNGAIGTVTAASPTSLTVTFSRKPKTAGSLTAIVTTNSINSGSAVGIASVTPRVIPNSGYQLGADATTLTINGLGFDTNTISNNTVAFDKGATGTVTAATEDSLTVSLGTPPVSAGNFNAIVTTNGLNSGAEVQVAVIAPVVTSSTIDISLATTELVIQGIGFDTALGNNTVLFDNGATGVVTAASGTSLTVTFTTPPDKADLLSAVVTSNGISSGEPVQVATVKPVVTQVTSSLEVNASSVTILGIGFSANIEDNTVTFNNGAEGTVVAATATSLTVNFSTNPTSVGSLNAVVTTNSQTSGSPVQVANVIPVVTPNSDPLDANASTLTLEGFGFDSTPGNNLVEFNNGAVGTVTSASATSLLVTFSTKPTSAGSLTATMRTNSIANAAAVQVATIKPVVTSSIANLSATSPTLVIEGFGFSPIAGNNVVVFDNGAIGSVTTATATALTVTFGTKPTSAGVLTAVVTSNSQSSGTELQVATVTPLVSTSSANLSANANSITINGFGFDTTAANNTIVFNNGAIGVVSSATATSLTVTLTTKPRAGGSLTAVVTSNGISSGSAIQVATVIPVVTANSSFRQSANGATLTINGIGFDANPVNNSVLFNNGAVGSVTAATATSLTVTFSTRPFTAGSLTAVVTTNGVASGATTQVATVAPVVTSVTSNLAADATTITINGFGFDPIASNNSVAFGMGAVGTVTAASTTTLVVTFSTRATSVGNLNVVVTSNSISSGTPVQIATVIPVVTIATSSLGINSSSIVINGFGFDSTPSRNTVQFNNGAVGSVTAATATSLTVSFVVKPLAVGNLTAVVTTNSLSSGSEKQIANVIGVVTSSSASRSANESTLAINGFGFDTTPGNNLVTFGGGAVGTVTSATATMLTVTFSTRPKAGNLTAFVTTNGVSSGTAVQVATVRPVVTSSVANVVANATTLTINGFGFDTTPGNNTLAFNLGAAGTVTAATATSLTVSITTTPTAVGDMTAVVTTNGVSSGTAVQVARILPVVTSNNANLALTSPNITINGFGFDTTAGNNLVAFNNGAIGTVTSSTANALTVAFTTPPTAGNLTAIVSRSGVSSGSAVQVATVKPVITIGTTSYPANLTTLTIAGSGFSATAGNNTVVLSNGAVGVVSSATSTLLTVTITEKPMAGNLTAIVTTNNVSSGTAVQVATINPVVTTSTVNLALNGSSLLINGFGFNPIASSNTVAFSGGVVGTVSVATSTSLLVTLSTKPVAGGSLTAIVTTNTRASGNAVQVALVSSTIVAPTVSVSTASLDANASTVTIAGTGFSTNLAENLVTLSSGAIGTVTAASTTSLTVTFSTKPRAGNLTAIVSVSGVPNSAAVQVASITPVVTVSNASLGASSTSLTINGFGFDPTAGNNTVTLSNGAVGSVSAATANALTVTLTTRPTSVGNLTAVVTTNSKSSGTALQVARVTPSATINAAPLAINASSIIINGFAFDPVAANNSVLFNNGAVGTVTSATANALTVNLSTKPTSIGSLTAVVTSNSISSGAPIQVATVRPVVTSNSSTLLGSATTIVINGEGFDSTAANNTVTLSNGAVGTVTLASATSLTVSFSTRPAVGSLTAIVTSNGISSGTAIQVATVLPVVTSSTVNLSANASSITLTGFGFDTTPSRNVVTFNNGAVGTVATATATTLTINFSTKPRTAGSLTAVVVANSLSSGTAVQVATIAPDVTSNAAFHLVNANTITINGFGFDATAGNNSVVFNNGAVGNVTAATATTLVVTFTTKPTTLGNLTAIVSSNSVSSGAAVQVATVRPVITSTTANLALSATTMMINGFGFDSIASNNVLVFNNGAVGTVSSATSTTLNVTFSNRPTAGNLTAVVTVNGVSSGTAAQVAVLVPTVTANTAIQSVNASTVTITGAGFDTTLARNTVVFNNGAVGTVTAAGPTSLTVTLSTRPIAAGSLTAVVTVNGVSSGSAIQVASISPVVTVNSANFAINATSIVISGFGFDSVASRNSVVFSNGAIGAVTASTATSLTVNIGTRPISVGNLTAVVTSNGVSSGTAVQVGSVIPAVTRNVTGISSTATSIVITGFGFSSTPGNNTVVFNNGAVGTVTNATPTSLTITFSTRPSAGSLTAIVTTSGASSGTAIQVASVTPTVTTSTANLSPSASTMTILGTGFDPIASRNTVVLNNGAIGTVTSATATSLTVTFSTRPTSGSLTAVVTTNGVSSGSAVQVAAVRPTVTASTTNLARTASSIVITGFGFSPLTGNNTVLFNNGAVGTVTTASATSLTVTFSIKPQNTGSLTAVVTTSGASSVTPVQVATMT